jgi:tryptophan halogenase
LLGQNIVPETYDPIVSALPHADVNESLESMRMAMLKAAAEMPTHEDFINRYCGAPTSPG